MVRYIVDSNFFIQAHRTTYPLDIAKGFWNKVSVLAAQGVISSIDKVRSELYDNNDALSAWCKKFLPDDFFKKTSDILDEYITVTKWALSMSNHYLPKALNEFMDANEADAFIIAYGMADRDNRIIVTQEISEPFRKNKIKIPDCCIAMKVRYLNTISMFRQLGETF